MYACLYVRIAVCIHGLITVPIQSDREVVYDLTASEGMVMSSRSIVKSGLPAKRKVFSQYPAMVVQKVYEDTRNE